jgi:alpha-beta hydrolase superfamily lysophospholipase
VTQDVGQTAPDILGAGYSAQTIPLPPDDEGDVVATLVRRQPSPTAKAAGRAVLYVHGYNDYFFQRELADVWDGWGYAFYALDLRKNGRSLRPWQTPSFVRHLGEYAAELDEALRRIRAAGSRHVVVVAHSTGGLTTALWLHHRRGGHGVAALVLNSPFLDLAGTATDRVLASLIGLGGRLRPYAVVPQPTVDVYARSLHVELGGEWDYDLAWKPAGGIPLRAGWLAAVREGHRAVRRGLAVDVPVLAMASTDSLRSRSWDERALRADSVLDADRIARLAARLGPDVSVVRVEGGLHDLVLSAAEVRQQVYAHTLAWLRERGVDHAGVINT